MSRFILSNYKRLLLIVACAYAINVCVRDELVARRETAPTRIDMADLRRDYAGQQWLSLTGRLDWDLARSGPSGNWLALVDPEDGPSDPVHVFVSTDGWTPPPLRRDEPVTVTGTQIFFDPAKLFPNVRRGEPFIMLQPGSKPDRPGFNLSLAVLFSVIMLPAVVMVIRSGLTLRGGSKGAGT